MDVVPGSSLNGLVGKLVCIYVPWAFAALKSSGFERKKYQLSQLVKRSFFRILKRLFVLDGVIFYLAGIFSGLFFFQLAKQWPDILRAFERVENTFNIEVYENNSSGWSMKKRIRVISWLLLFLALTEHLSSWSSFLYDRLIQIELCKWKIGSMFFYLATTHLYQIYAKLPVKVITVVWAEYMNISLTFAWNFIDLFIIIVSIGVASKFQKINKRLEFFRGRVSRDQNTNLSFQLFMFLDCQRKLLGWNSSSLQRSMWATRIYRCENRQHCLLSLFEWLVLCMPSTS